MSQQTAQRVISPRQESYLWHELADAKEDSRQLRRRLRAILAAYDADGNGAESLTRLCEEIEASREVCGA